MTVWNIPHCCPSCHQEVFYGGIFFAEDDSFSFQSFFSLTFLKILGRNIITLSSNKNKFFSCCSMWVLLSSFSFFLEIRITKGTKINSFLHALLETVNYSHTKSSILDNIGIVYLPFHHVFMLRQRFWLKQSSPLEDFV